MAELDTTWCELGEMEAYMCACRIHARAKGLKDIAPESEAAEWPPPGEIVVVAKTIARPLGSRCNACNNQIKAGDPIVLIQDYQYWIHADCADDDTP